MHVFSASFYIKFWQTWGQERKVGKAAAHSGEAAVFNWNWVRVVISEKMLVKKKLPLGILEGRKFILFPLSFSLSLDSLLAVDLSCVSWTCHKPDFFSL